MLASQAVERAYREAAIVARGATLSAVEYDEGLDRLNGFIDSLFGAEIGQLLTDVQVPLIQRSTNNANANFNQPFPLGLSDFDQPLGALEQRSTSQYVLAPNSRILWRATTPTTVYLPQNPGDGARIAVVNTGATAALLLDANGRRINGADTIAVSTVAADATYFYRADLADWRPISQLALTDDLPLPAEFDRLLICGTAIALTALDEINPTSGTMFTYDRLLKRCKERYFQREAVTPGGQNLVNSDQAFEYAVEPRRW